MLNRRAVVKLGLSSLLLPLGCKSSIELKSKIVELQTPKAIEFPEEDFIRWRVDIGKPYDLVTYNIHHNMSIYVSPWEDKRLKDRQVFNDELIRMETSYAERMNHSKCKFDRIISYYCYDPKSNRCAIHCSKLELTKEDFTQTGAYWN